MIAETIVIGLHLVSLHAAHTERGDIQPRTETPGIYLKLPLGVMGGQVTAGALRNSLGRPSFYLGQTWTGGRWSLLAAGVTGYDKRVTVSHENCARAGFSVGPGDLCRTESGVGWRITPMVVPSVALPQIGGITPRLSLAVSSMPALHFSIEKEFK